MWFIILYNGEDEYRCGITALLELLTCLEYSMLHFDDGVWLHCCVLVAYMKCVRPGLLVLPLVPLQNSSEESREKTGWCFHFAFAHEPQLVVVFDPIRVLKVYSCALAHRCMCSEDDQRCAQRVLTSVISPVCSACTSLAHAEFSELQSYLYRTDFVQTKPLWSALDSPLITTVRRADASGVSSPAFLLVLEHWR